ncbi:hypothetical protein C0214_19620 [Methylobacterium sp. DM1]|nr:hypothetical protein C0214_19620 [Methylobacterium sp. DM1]
MLYRLAIAAALGLGLTDAASAQNVQTVTDCAGVQRQGVSGGRLYVDQAGRLCIVINGATGTATIGSTTVRSSGTNRSATVGTTAANLWPVNANRQGGWIKNDAATDIWCNYDGTASATPGGGNFKIAASGGFYDTEANFVSTNALSCIGTAATAITSREH